MEKGSKQVTFLCPGPDEFAKIIWIEGQAVGFYTMKLKGKQMRLLHDSLEYQLKLIDQLKLNISRSLQCKCWLQIRYPCVSTVLSTCLRFCLGYSLLSGH